jgi:hypothetical protein
MENYFNAMFVNLAKRITLCFPGAQSIVEVDHVLFHRVAMD